MKPIKKETIETWNEELSHLNPQEIINWTVKTFPKDLSLACSLSAEDTVLLHTLNGELSSNLSHNICAFVLDTGRLHEKSYEVLDSCRVRYKHIPIHIYFPNHEKVEKLTREKGMYSFYTSLENRKECCFIRKIEPLQRALKGRQAWITGLRKEQSITRSDHKIVELDSIAGTQERIIKINPLLNCSWEYVLDFANKNKVPIHPLHAKAYPSIGCEPCTRAVQEGESLRAGRWWWENASSKECGLHVK